MIGMVREYKGQRYECVAILPHIRPDKERTEIAVWESGCARCGEPFLFRSPVNKETFMPSRRCRDHKSAGRKVTDQELAEAARKLEERKAKERRRIEEARLAEEAKLAEEMRIAEERWTAALTRHRDEQRRRGEEPLRRYKAQMALWQQWKQDGAEAWELFSKGDRVHTRRGLATVIDINGDEVTVRMPNGEHKTAHFRIMHKYFPIPEYCRVEHHELGEGTVVGDKGDSIVVAFDAYGHTRNCPPFLLKLVEI
jgi:hypothetical protein